MESCIGTSRLLLPVSGKSPAQPNHTQPVVVGMQPLPYKIRKGELQTTSSQHPSPRIRCAAAVNARCAAFGQTQTIAREARTINITPGKTKSPKLDDNRPGLPPRDNDDNGGNGGGGENWSGGLALLGILGVLDILKEIETEWLRKNERRFSRE